MEEQAYTLHIRQADTYHYDVTRPKIGATKMAPTLEGALTISVHEILKHLTTRSLILVFVDQRVDRDGGCVDAQGDPHTDLEHQAVLEGAQLGRGPQVKRKERLLVFESSRQLTRAHARWLDEHTGTLFERKSTKDEVAVKLDAWLEEARDYRKEAPYE